MKARYLILILIFVTNCILLNGQITPPKNSHIMIMIDASGSMKGNIIINDDEVKKWSNVLEKVLFEGSEPGEYTSDDMQFPIINDNSIVSVYKVGTGVYNNLLHEKPSQRTEIKNLFPTKKTYFDEPNTNLDAAALEFYREVEKSDYEVYWVFLSDEQLSLSFSGDNPRELIDLSNKYPVQVLYRKQLFRYRKSDGTYNEIKLTVRKVKSDPGKYLTINQGNKIESLQFNFDTLSAKFKLQDTSALTIFGPKSGGVMSIRDIDIWLKFYDTKKDTAFIGEYRFKPTGGLPAVISTIDTTLIKKNKIKIGEVYNLYIAARYIADGRLINQDLTEQYFAKVKFIGKDTPPTPPHSSFWWLLLIPLGGIGAYAFYLYNNRGVLHTFVRVGGIPAQNKEFYLKPGAKVYFGQSGLPGTKQLIYDVRASDFKAEYKSPGLFVLSEKSENKDIKTGIEFEVINADKNPVKLKIIEGKLSQAGGTKKPVIFNPKKR